jgi:integrase/recombinase XerD
LPDPKLLKQYQSRLITQERRSRLTAETYCFEIRHFLDWLDTETLNPAEADTLALSRYLEYRRQQDSIESPSVAKAISALRSFFRFMVDERLRPDNPSVIL